MKKTIIYFSMLVVFTSCKTTQVNTKSVSSAQLYRIDRSVFEKLTQVQAGGIPVYYFNEVGVVFYCDSFRDSIARNGITSQFIAVMTRDSLLLPPRTACQIESGKVKFLNAGFDINFNSTITTGFTPWQLCYGGVYYCRSRIENGREIEKQKVSLQNYNSNPKYYNKEYESGEDNFLRLQIDQNTVIEKNGKRYIAKGLKTPVYLLSSLEALSQFSGSQDLIKGVPIK